MKKYSDFLRSDVFRIFVVGLFEPIDKTVMESFESIDKTERKIKIISLVSKYQELTGEVLDDQEIGYFQSAISRKLKAIINDFLEITYQEEWLNKYVKLLSEIQIKYIEPSENIKILIDDSIKVKGRSKQNAVENHEYPSEWLQLWNGLEEKQIENLKIIPIEGSVDFVLGEKIKRKENSEIIDELYKKFKSNSFKKTRANLIFYEVQRRIMEKIYLDLKHEGGVGKDDYTNTFLKKFRLIHKNDMVEKAKLMQETFSDSEVVLFLKNPEFYEEVFNKERREILTELFEYPEIQVIYFDSPELEVIVNCFSEMAASAVEYNIIIPELKKEEWKIILSKLDGKEIFVEIIKKMSEALKSTHPKFLEKLSMYVKDVLDTLSERYEIPQLQGKLEFVLGNDEDNEKIAVEFEFSDEEKKFIWTE